jgi:hypothetical protein
MENYLKTDETVLLISTAAFGGYQGTFVVTTQRVIFNDGSSFVVLRLGEIDSVNAGSSYLWVTARGTEKRFQFPRRGADNEASHVISQAMMRL